MAITDRRTTVVERCKPDTIPWQDLTDAMEPVVLKGLVRDWGLVKAGLKSAEDAMTYLNSYYNGKTVGTYFGDAAIGGRYFYNDDATALNFEKSRSPLDETLEKIRQHLHEDRPPSIYIGSTTVDACLPGMRAENDLTFNHEMFSDNEPLISIWIGNPAIASCHYDAPNNIACCAVGKRRFTLFPPDQIENLYPGPLDLNPGGQAISMVNFSAPEFDRYPRFRDAIGSAQVADLDPGDALFYPSMWWHHVESLSPFNAMINYWWNTSPDYMGTPMHILKHAILSLRDRPEHEKAAWKRVFDYYIFGPPDRPRAHLAQQAHGELGPIDDLKARKLRAELVRSLNR